MPPMPRQSGWDSGMALLPSSVVETGIWAFSASSSTSAWARAMMTPRPIISTGRLALLIISAAWVT